MGLITKMLSPQAVAPPAGDDFWYQPVGTDVAGVRVTPTTAMMNPTAFACTKVITEDVAQLPCLIYRKRADGGRDRDRQHPLYDILHDQPNPWMTAFEFWEMGVGHVLNRGNFYAQIDPGPRGAVDRLTPLHPDRVEPEALPDGSRRYKVRRKDGTEYFLMGDQVFHVPGLGYDGLKGYSVISFAARSIGRSLSAERYSTKMMENGSKLSGVLQHPGELTPRAAKALQKSWQSAHAGPDNAGKVAVLEEGMTWEAMGMTAEDAQFIEQEVAAGRDIARFYRVQAHLIGSLERATFNNIEHLSLEHVVYTLMPWLKRFEQRIKMQLILSPNHFVEFLVDALLRGDVKNRWEAYGVAKRLGAINVDEIRLRENMNPLPNGEGQEYVREANMVPNGTPAPAGTSGRAAVLAATAAARVVRKENSALSKAAITHADDAEGWSSFVAQFYGEHAAFVAKVMVLPEEAATAYVEGQKESVLANGVGVLEQTEEQRVDELTALAIGADE